MANADLSSRHKMLHALICFFVVPMSGLGIDIYTPSLPSIMHYFSADSNAAKYSISIYILSIGIFQPIVGPLSDSLGRKWFVIFGLGATVIMMWLATLSTSIHMLWAIRFFQGMTISFALVPARALLKDLFDGDEFKRSINTLTVVWALGPLIAPYIGGYIQTYWGWKANFYTLAIYAFVAALFACAVLKETIPQRQPLHFGKMLASYGLILKNTEFLKSTLVQSMCYCHIVVYGVLGSFLIQASMHYSAVVFGQTALAVGCAWLIGNLFNRFISQISDTKKALYCCVGGLLTSIIMIILAALGHFSLNSLLIPVLFITFFASIIYPILFGNAIALFPKHAATASAVNVGLVMIFVSVLTTISSSIHDANLFPISITYFIFWCVSLVMYPSLFKRL
ncbi:MAG: MFS transporter [Coxiellaceae bacterium]|nr:MFS transporter [Coxiellaceae bacterium]